YPGTVSSVSSCRDREKIPVWPPALSARGTCSRACIVKPKLEAKSSRACSTRGRSYWVGSVLAQTSRLSWSSCCLRSSVLLSPMARSSCSSLPSSMLIWEDSSAACLRAGQSPKTAAAAARRKSSATNTTGQESLPLTELSCSMGLHPLHVHQETVKRRTGPGAGCDRLGVAEIHLVAAFRQEIEETG